MLVFLRHTLLRISLALNHILLSRSNTNCNTVFAPIFSTQLLCFDSIELNDDDISTFCETAY